MATSSLKLTGFGATPSRIARRKLADSLIAAGSSGEPIRSGWQSANRLAQALIGGLTARELMNEEDAATETMGKALKAYQPWRAPDDIYAANPQPGVYENPTGASVTAPAPYGPPAVLGPPEPIARAGEPVPGTGGRAAMAEVLAGNKLTAPLALQMQLGQMSRADELATAIAEARAKEKIFMGGRGSPTYLGAVEAAKRPSLDRVAAEATAKREPVPDAAARARAIAAARRDPLSYVTAAARARAEGTEAGKGNWQTLTSEEVTRRGLDTSRGQTYQEGPHGEVKEIAHGLAPREAAFAAMPPAEQRAVLKKSLVNVDLSGKGLVKLNEKMAEDLLKRREEAFGAVSALRAIEEAKSLFAQGITAGTGATLLTKVDSLLRDRLGINLADNPTANTQAFAGVTGNLVAQVIRRFGSGTGLSDADREYAENISGGNVELTSAAISRLLDMNERAQTWLLTSYNQQADEVMGKPGAENLMYDLHVKADTADAGKPETPEETRQRLKQKYGIP